MVKIACLVIFIAIPSNAQKTVQCPFSWMHYNGTCYGFLKQQLTWLDGMMTCKIYGAHLVEIQTKEKNTWLVKQFKSMGYDTVWLGASDQFHEGLWYWVVSQKQVGPFKNWNVPQPDNHKGNEHCMEVRKNRRYQWNDNNCEEKQRVVCEQKL